MMLLPLVLSGFGLATAFALAGGGPGYCKHHACTTSTITTTTVTTTEATNPVPPPATGALFGAYINGRDTYPLYYGGTWSNAPIVDPGTQDSWQQFEVDAGKPIDFLMFGNGGHTLWDGTPFNYDGGMGATIARGAIPVLDVSSGSAALTDIASGVYDAATSAWFQEAAAWGHPFVLRFDAEMNGSWYSYGAQARQNPAAFVSAWRHLHDLAVAAGATNISWHWCPNVDPEGIQTPIASVYPGDAYVNWVGFTGYNAGNEAVGWLYDTTYSAVASLAPSKPMMIGEMASVDTLGSVPGTANPAKTQWINDFAGWLPAHPAVKAFTWFNWHIYEGGVFHDWEIESSLSAEAAFRSLVASPYVIGR